MRRAALVRQLDGRAHRDGGAVATRGASNKLVLVDPAGVTRLPRG